MLRGVEGLAALVVLQRDTAAMSVSQVRIGRAFAAFGVGRPTAAKCMRFAAVTPNRRLNHLPDQGPHRDLSGRRDCCRPACASAEIRLFTITLLATGPIVVPEPPVSVETFPPRAVNFSRYRSYPGRAA